MCAMSRVNQTGQEQQVTLRGESVTLVGNRVKVGQQAPDFIAIDQDLSPTPFSTFRGKPCVISSVVSLDTDVCDAETRWFNEQATRLAEDVQVLTISMDLPFAQQRWCAAAGIERVTTLSDHRDASFGVGYGVLIKDLRLLARAIFLINRAGEVCYRQIVPEITHEPDYEEVLQAARELT